jgi:hypothetical protein
MRIQEKSGETIFDDENKFIVARFIGELTFQKLVDGKQLDKFVQLAKNNEPGSACSVFLKLIKDSSSWKTSRKFEW